MPGIGLGLTIHKSQGLTLTEVVVNLGPQDFSLGLVFVAISCVKNTEGFGIQGKRNSYN